MLTRKIITVISTGRWLGLICSHRGDEFPATALHHLRRLDRGVPPCGSVRHHLTIGQQAAVTALTDLLSQPDSVRPGPVRPGCANMTSPGRSLSGSPRRRWRAVTAACCPVARWWLTESPGGTTPSLHLRCWSVAGDRSSARLQLRPRQQ